MKIIKPVKLSFLVFLFYIIITPLAERFHGVGGRGMVGPSDPLDWSEVLQRFPNTLLTGFLLSLFGLLGFIYAFKADKKKWEDIRRENSEKEKMHSISKSLIDSDVVDEGERLNSDSQKRDLSD